MTCRSSDDDLTSFLRIMIARRCKKVNASKRAGGAIQACDTCTSSRSSSDSSIGLSDLGASAVIDICDSVAVERTIVCDSVEVDRTRDCVCFSVGRA